ncbi:MAG: hypothetical protein N4A71_07770 [Carboxylicivirga sp.]|jgi:hypothetical protein|nr:hypothetical protein [Carboxylicivirga sp.]
MKHILALTILLTAFSSITSAQVIKAITQHGETVVLYENGTWKYEKDLDKEKTVVTAPVAPLTPKKAPATASIGIDTTKNISSEKIEIFNAVSKKLSRFFGEEKGRVRCSASASNKKGVISIDFEFMMQVGDANRYFGYSSLDRNMSFQLSDGRTLNNSFTQNIEEKFIEKWNVSYYKCGIVLSKEDVLQLLKNNTMRMTVDWKKTEEEYIIENIEAIKQLLIEVI